MIDLRVVFKRDRDENITMQIEFAGKIADRLTNENRSLIFPNQFSIGIVIAIAISCSGETSMNRFGSHPNHGNLVNTGYWEGSQLQGISEARRGKFGLWEGIEAAAKAPAEASPLPIVLSPKTSSLI